MTCENCTCTDDTVTQENVVEEESPDHRYFKIYGNDFMSNNDHGGIICIGYDHKPGIGYNIGVSFVHPGEDYIKYILRYQCDQALFYGEGLSFHIPRIARCSFKELRVVIFGKLMDALMRYPEAYKWARDILSENYINMSVPRGSIYFDESIDPGTNKPCNEWVISSDLIWGNTTVYKTTFGEEFPNLEMIHFSGLPGDGGFNFSTGHGGVITLGFDHAEKIFVPILCSPKDEFRNNEVEKLFLERLKNSNYHIKFDDINDGLLLLERHYDAISDQFLPDWAMSIINEDYWGFSLPAAIIEEFIDIDDATSKIQYRLPKYYVRKVEFRID